MLTEGTVVALDDGRTGIIEVASEDDHAYHVRLESGYVVQVDASRVAPIQVENDTLPLDPDLQALMDRIESDYAMARATIPAADHLALQAAEYAYDEQRSAVITEQQRRNEEGR